jgi:two-component system sensor histidine kinase DegS
MTAKLDSDQLDSIISNTIEAIEKGKSQLSDISDVAKKEKKRIVEEFEEAKRNVVELSQQVKQIENELIESKKQLLKYNKYYEKFTEQEKKDIYTKTENQRVELAVKRELEQMTIQRRNELEFRVKDASNMVEKTNSLISTIGTAMSFLTGNLQSVSSQIEDIQQKQGFGIKIIKAQEEERKRVAREIHDGPAQSMSNVVLKAEICEKLLQTDVELAKEEIRDLKGVVRESLQDVRRIIYDLRPMSLDDLGLVPTLQRYVNSFIEENNIPTTFRSRGNLEKISSVTSLTIFRILQEAMNNIKKYSKARKVTVNLEMINEEIVFVIIDDGIGFDLEDAKKKHFDISGGFGLFSMSERIELLEGKFEIISSKGNGTKLTAKIPFVME